MDMRVAAYAVIVDADDRILLAHWNEGAAPRGRCRAAVSSRARIPSTPLGAKCARRRATG